jgi:phage gpG-like protein
MKLVRQITETIAVLVENDILNNFDKEAFNNQAWGPRKREDRQQGRRALLVKTGQMKRGISVRVEGKLIAVYSDMNYAIYHNEGTDKIPKRQFVGFTDELEKQIDKEVDAILEKFFSE